MNRRRCADLAATYNVPRARGDEPRIPPLVEPESTTFPARAGMNQKGIEEAEPVVGTFPARAGMNRLTATALASASHVPRARGDELLGMVGHTADWYRVPQHAGMNRMLVEALRSPRFLICFPTHPCLRLIDTVPSQAPPIWPGTTCSAPRRRASISARCGARLTVK